MCVFCLLLGVCVFGWNRSSPQGTFFFLHFKITGTWGKPPLPSTHGVSVEGAKRNPFCVSLCVALLPFLLEEKRKAPRRSHTHTSLSLTCKLHLHVYAHTLPLSSATHFWDARERKKGQKRGFKKKQHWLKRLVECLSCDHEYTWRLRGSKLQSSRWRFDKFEIHFFLVGCFSSRSLLPPRTFFFALISHTRRWVVEKWKERALLDAHT